MVPKPVYNPNRPAPSTSHPAARVYNQSPIKNKAKENQPAKSIDKSQPTKSNSHQRLAMAFPSRVQPNTKKTCAPGTIVLPKQIGKSVTQMVPVKNVTQAQSPQRDEHGRIPLVTALLAQHAIVEPDAERRRVVAESANLSQPKTLQFSSEHAKDVKRPTPTKPVVQLFTGW